MVARKVLKNDADALAQRRLVPLLEVETVEQHPSVSRIVKPREQFDQSGFAGTVLPDQRQTLAGADMQIDTRQGRRGGARVDELDVLETNAVAGIGTCEFKSFEAAAADRLLQVLKQVRQIQVVLI